MLLRGEIERVFQAAVNAAARVHRFLDGDLVRRALENETAGAGVEALAVLAHDREINVLRPLVLERTVGGAEQFHRAEIDVLFQFEPQPQQEAFFQNAGLHLRVADGAEENGLVAAELLDGAVGQHLARLQKSLAAEVVMMPVEFETEPLCSNLGHFDAFAHHFGAGAVTGKNCD